MNKYAVRAPAHVPRVTLGAYVRRAFPLLPESAVRGAFESRDVKIDGKRCGEKEPVPPGGEICVYTPYEMRMPVVYEDARLLALDKPAGVSCDADAYGSMTVADWAALYAQGAYTPRLCHRLDNPTSGLILLAKDQETEEAVRAALACHEADKTYVCLVKGPVRPQQAEHRAWLAKDAAHARVRVGGHETAGAKEIVTAYETLADGPVALLRVGLRTGRTHQIRAHMAYLGYPVLGDDQYGDRAFNRAYGTGRLMLRSVGMRLDTHGRAPQLDGISLRVPYELDGILAGIMKRSRE